jgi:histidinol-phosphatase
MFSTQIALMHRGRLELGVSCAPVYGETAWAERGGGAWQDGVPLAVSPIATLEEATVSTGNLRSLANGPRWAALGRMVVRLDRIRGFGDFLHYHLLAAGKIEAVIESDINILDIAALTVIVEEAGGRVTDLEGAPIGLESRSILASNGALHEMILAELGAPTLRR